MLPILYWQYYACWCSGDLGAKATAGLVFDPQSWNMSSPASEELKSMLFNSLWPSDTVCQHRTWSSLVQVMACSQTAPSHYLNQCWLIISEVLWHSTQAQRTISWEMLKLSILDMSLKMTTVMYLLEAPSLTEAPPPPNESAHCHGIVAPPQNRSAGRL